MINWLKQQLGWALTGISTILIGAVVLVGKELIPPKLLDPVSKLSLAQLSGGLFLAFLALLIYTVILYRRMAARVKLSDFYFVEDPGYYVSKKDGGKYCVACLAKGAASRLSFHHEDGLKCRVCGQVYISPQAYTAAFAAAAKLNGA